jgi:hypothetical protein
MSVLSMVSILQRIKELYEKIATREVLAIVVVVVMALLTSGFIYVLVQAPGALASTSSGGSSFVAKSSSSMTSTEMFVSFILTIVGASGFILLEGALKKSYDLTGSRIRYLVGIVMIVLAIGLFEGIAYIKIH